MKLIVNMPEEVKRKVCAYDLRLGTADKEQLVNAIVNSIPLDKVIEDIKAEIEQVVNEESDDKKWARGLHHSIIIIDKNISGKEHRMIEQKESEDVE